MIFLNRILEFIELSFYFSNSQFDMARTNNLMHIKEEYI